MRSSPLLFLLAASLSLGLVACSGPEVKQRVDDVIQTPGSYANASGGVSLEGWCGDLNQGELEVLVDEALAGNFNLKASWARLAQSEAIARGADASMWPTVTAGADIGRSKSFSQFGTLTNNQYKLSVAASYELDLWGKMAAQRDAASYDNQAMRADTETMAITIAAQVTESWLTVVYQREQRALVEAQLETSERYLELTLLRLGQNQASALDVTQQQQQVESIRARLELITQQELTAMYQLAVLTGRNPGSLSGVSQDRLPDVSPTPSVGVPADLLEQRPDVRSALLRLSAADARAAVAVREWLPSVRLSASLFFQAFDIEKLFEELLWSIGASISQTVWEGGRFNAEIDRTEAAAYERLYSYAQTLLDALREVETALLAEQQQIKYMEHLDTQTSQARVALDLSRERYRRGALDFLRLITALQSLQQLELKQLDARRQQLTNRVQLCRAVGGRWTRDLDAPAFETEEVK